MAQKIAKLIINGVIEEENETYRQTWILDTIDKLQSKKTIAGIILYIDSPGGCVYETDEVYEALLKYKKETQKPVYAYFSSLAASGGYYIACAADKIIANRNSLTGSIGVIAGNFIDLSELLKKHGIKSEIIHTGKNKTIGNPAQPLNEEQRKIMQSIADECYEQFTEIVSFARKINIDKIKELADGRIYTAKQAKNLGLVDEVATFDDAVKFFNQNVFGNSEYSSDVKEYKMKPKKNLMKLLRGETNTDLLQNFANKILGLKQLRFPAFYTDFRK